MASDALEGRRTGTAGADAAMDYLVKQYERMGIGAKGSSGYLQKFEINEGLQMDPSTQFKVNNVQLKIEKDFFPLATSASSHIAGNPAMALHEKGQPWFKDIKETLEENKSNPHFDIEAWIKKEVTTAASKGSTAFIIYNTGTVVDNIFASPVLQKPVLLGADIIVYSGTKHIDGQGRVLGGAILSSKKFKENVLKPFLRHTGPAISPFNAWVLLKGLETIKIRVEAQSNIALEIAQFLDKHSKIEKVFYPFLKNFSQYSLAKKQQTLGGTILSFKIKGKKKDAFKFINKLKIFDISNNLGDTKSIVTHPTTTTHRILSENERLSLGITENLIRLSIGLETVSDLKKENTIKKELHFEALFLVKYSGC